MNNISYTDENLQERVSKDGSRVSEEEYWEHYYEHPDFNYEWNNGILEEVPVSDFKNISMYYWFIRVLGYYIETQKTGRVVFHDFGFRLALPEKTTIRKPDLAIVVTDNPSDLEPDDRSFRGTFDLCVELISDLTTKAIIRDTVDKKTEYEAIGVEEYYILDASNKHMAFYRRTQDGVFKPIKLVDGDIVQSEVLKGFRFRVSDLFKEPSIEKLIEDEVYYDFVFPTHRIIKQEAERQRHRADFAERKAEEERQRAVRLEEKLRALGISID